jgi:hypothetical protein
MFVTALEKISVGLDLVRIVFEMHTFGLIVFPLAPFLAFEQAESFEYARALWPWSQAHDLLPRQPTCTVPSQSRRDRTREKALLPPRTSAGEQNCLRRALCVCENKRVVCTGKRA